MIPILQAILSHLRQNPQAYHVPGHKMGRGLPGEIGQWLGAAGRLDLTEIPGLDDLHAPEAAILAAEQLAAQAFGAEETYFLVNGSTAGNLAMIMAAVRPGETILVPRSLHKSALNGLILAQATPAFYVPDVDETFGLVTGVSVDTIREAIRQHPHAKAIFVTSPTYQGVCSDLRAIADLAHEAGMVLLVDEAHGAPFAFHEELPMTAMQAGADAAVQSTHKLLGSLTQSSMLHVQGTRLDRVRLRKRLQLVQSTSPSYLLMASLDAARDQMQTEGFEKIDQALRAIRAGVERLKQIPGLELLQETGGYPVDPFKWTICVTDLGLTGTEAYQMLQERGFTLELSDSRNILAVFTYADGERQVSRLVDALEKIVQDAAAQQSAADEIEEMKQDAVASKEQDGSSSRSESHDGDEERAMKRQRANQWLLAPQHLERRVPLHEAFEQDAEVVPLRQAIGRAAAEMVIPYPPGIPLIVPGEVWTEELVIYIEHLLQAGLRFQGVEDRTLATVHVLRDF